MTLVIVVAAIVALVLLGLIVVFSRSRFSDESERFQYVSGLTSQWSRQQQARPAAGKESPGSIDLRDSGRSSAGAPADGSAGASAGAAVEQAGSRKRR